MTRQNKDSFLLYDLNQTRPEASGSWALKSGMLHVPDIMHKAQTSGSHVCAARPCVAKSANVGPLPRQFNHKLRRRHEHGAMHHIQHLLKPL